MKPNRHILGDTKRGLSFLWVMLMGMAFSFQAKAETKKLIHRSSETSGSISLCNPTHVSGTAEDNLRMPRGPHAVCLELDANDQPVRFFRYDRNGNLEASVMGSNPTAPATIEYHYSVTQKLSKIVDRSHGTELVTKYLHTATGERIAMKDAQGNLDVIFEKNLRFTNNVPRVTYGNDVEIDKDGVTPIYYVRDHLESVVAAATPSSILEKNDYLPYGERWYRTGVVATDVAFTGAKEEGKYLDYNARTYDPKLGKFLQADSMVPGANTLATNRYTYVFNNPVKYTDPTGHFPVLAAVLVSAALNTLAHKDHIDSFHDFMGVAMAGAAMGAAPGLGQAIGGGVLAMAAAGAAGNALSTKITYETFGVKDSGRAVGRAAVMGAISAGVGSSFAKAGRAVTNGVEKATMRGAQAMTRLAAGQVVNAAFGYQSQISGADFGSYLATSVAFGDPSNDPVIEGMKTFAASVGGGLLARGEVSSGDLQFAFASALGDTIVQTAWVNEQGRAEAERFDGLAKLGDSMQETNASIENTRSIIDRMQAEGLNFGISQSSR